MRRGVDCSFMVDGNEISPPLSTEVQRFGALIACDRNLEEITHVSDAIADVLGQAPSSVLGASPASVLPREFIHDLRNIISLRHFSKDRHFAGRHDLPMGARDISVSHSSPSGHVVIEFEAAADSLYSADDFSIELRQMSGALRAAGDDGQMIKALTAMLRFSAGYDSALAYRFQPTGGEVIAEAGSLAQRRFLGERLWYLEKHPDAMTEVRDPILHFTADADLGLAAILSLDSAPDGLDLSHCNLRGTPRAELDGLTKMGARAALTLPIVVNGGIWGMALLLSQEPRTPSRYVRQLCDALALVVCDRLEVLPLSSTTPPPVAMSQPAKKADFRGKCALVVEDDDQIASNLKLMLLDLGFATVDTFADAASALEYLDANEVDVGVLDAHLKGTSTSLEIARKLAEEGAPFLFASETGATADAPGCLGPRPVVLKSVTKRDLSACIDELLVVGLAGRH